MKRFLRELRISRMFCSYAHALVVSTLHNILHARIQIALFFKEHPNVLNFLVSLVLAVFLYIIYSIVAGFYPPRTMGEYIVFAEYRGNLYSVTHRYMLPVVYSSMVFIIPSLSYLNRKMVRTFEEIKELIREPERVSNKSLKFASSHYRYLIASVVAFLLLFGPFVVTWIFFIPFELVYITLPTTVIVWLVYLLVAFFSALGIWLVLASVYFIRQVASQQFRIDIEDPSSWIDDDEIGGFKRLSDFSLQVFGLLVLGLLLFSPAALLYYATWYVIYIFTLLPIGFLFLLITQRMLHKSIRRHKKRFIELARMKRNTREITSRDYVSTLLAIKAIKDRPVDLNILWGIFISSFVLPALLWYVFTLLRNYLGITMPPL